MEIQLQDLIEQIKKDGVEAAEAKADEILAAAKSEADRIIADANAEAEGIIAGAKEENDRYVRVSEDSIRQAGRNLLISFRESVNREVKAILFKETERALKGENLSELIVRAVSALSETPDASDLSVLLASDDLKSIESSLISKLKDKMLSGVILTPSDNFDGGFRIAVDGGKAYYDYSAAEVTNMLSAFLAPKVTALLKEEQ